MVNAGRTATRQVVSLIPLAVASTIAVRTVRGLETKKKKNNPRSAKDRCIAREIRIGKRRRFNKKRQIGRALGVCRSEGFDIPEEPEENKEDDK